jgi:hypothetical protein
MIHMFWEGVRDIREHWRLYYIQFISERLAI